MARSLKRLDVEKTEVKTTYCISQDAREDQIRIALSKVKKRFSPEENLRTEEIAIVCYGPSLKKNWEELKSFKYIMTCSGSHDFLINKGIIPTWHVDLDPREHKALMITPHQEVKYLLASCMHPKVWEKVKGFDVSLWHIYNNETNKDLPVVYPRGDWIFTGGNNVGLRCLVLARALGFREFHIFGMDFSFPKSCESHHADSHINAPKDIIYEVPYDGKMYYCEPVMVDYARQFFHEVDLLPDVTIKLHGEGLLQHMVSREQGRLKTKPKAVIAFSTPITFSENQVEKYKKLHLDPTYGINGKNIKKVVIELANSLKTASVLDYGCGKGTLGASLPMPIWEYDPAIPGKDGVPRPAELVICQNVLEYVEPEFLTNVLGDLVRCTNKCLYAIIEGKKEYWQPVLSDYFNIGAIFEEGANLLCVLEPKPLMPI